MTPRSLTSQACATLTWIAARSRQVMCGCTRTLVLLKNLDSQVIRGHDVTNTVAVCNLSASQRYEVLSWKNMLGWSSRWCQTAREASELMNVWTRRDLPQNLESRSSFSDEQL